jgi:hypothetical protein
LPLALRKSVSGALVYSLTGLKCLSPSGRVAEG